MLTQLAKMTGITLSFEVITYIMLRARTLYLIQFGR